MFCIIDNISSAELCHCERAELQFPVERSPFSFCHGYFAFEKVDRLCERDFLVLYVDAVNFCKNFFVVVGCVNLLAVFGRYLFFGVKLAKQIRRSDESFASGYKFFVIFG